MARWKLSRTTFSNEEIILVEGEEVTLGRGVQNTIALSSIVVSRNHCSIKVNADNILITDLKSSNGVYVGLKKIPPNVPVSVEDSDIIGIGWTNGASVANINNNEKYVYKLTKEKPPPVTSRLKFQSDNDIELVLADGVKTADNISPNNHDKSSRKTSLEQHRQSPVFNSKSSVKRKIDVAFNNVKVKTEGSKKYKIDENVINISDSEPEQAPEPESSKKLIAETVCENPISIMSETDIKTEKEDLEYDVFKVKQEYLGYDEPIQIDSESDVESANWLQRLSQNSPGKPLATAVRKSKTPNIENEESSYSQMDDFGEDFMDDLISFIPPDPPTNSSKQSPDSGLDDKTPEQRIDSGDDDEYLEDPICFHNVDQPPPNRTEAIIVDVVDSVTRTISAGPESNLPITLVCDKNQQKLQTDKTGVRDDLESSNSNLLKDLETNYGIPESSDNSKKALVIEALAQPPRNKSSTHLDNKTKALSSSSRHSKHKKHSSSRRHITNSQKEERKKRLKDIASKEKEENVRRSSKRSNSSKDKGVVNAKVTNTNRGAFLTDVVQGVVKPMKRKESPQKITKAKERIEQKSFVKEPREDVETKNKSNKSELILKEALDDIENKKRQSDKHNSSKHKEKTSKEHKSLKHKEKSESSKIKPMHSKLLKSSPETRTPLKSLKPLTESDDSCSGKPFSKVEPMPNSKPRKSVSFSDDIKVIHFEIEEGNHMKKISMAKSLLVDVRQKPVFSLEKITLMKILRWNPRWLEEQINNNDSPPILGSHHPPLTVFHTFSNHNQYVQVVGDLLLMEIWECLSQGYMRVRKSAGIQMRIASLPPVSSQDRCIDLCNLSVDVSVPNSEVKTVPRMGEMILMTFGPEHAQTKRFFYVHNVRVNPAPPNNKNSFFCISLHTCYTDKMKSLKPGELMIGLTLTYIQQELALFEAIEHMASSPLSDIILKPEPRHFVKCDPNAVIPQSQWTKILNPSQMMAVHSTVAAALSDRPSIQMVQGPPGTGKSSVICAMVMTYLFSASGQRHKNRGKILICATSNAAVDYLVIRLLKIRQNQPKAERFRMVRVGRAEAMHPRAHDISSQQLAQRDVAARHHADPAHPARQALAEEISHLQAKVNMWKTQEQDAKDQVRAAYCQQRVKEFTSRLALMQSSGGRSAPGGQLSPEEFGAIERSIIEGADVIVTTLASAQNNKLKGLCGRIALCIVDEAGQAIESETLIPLTLNITKISLVGDPQQLPGFICSQRAKKFGLGESLFYRLTSCAEEWGEGSPVILLNQQYRMQSEIADYPNRAFYGGRILSMPLARPNIEIPAYSIVSIASGDKGQCSSGANEMEAWGVARLVLALQASLRPRGLGLAVITPYNAHKELIKRHLRTLQDPNDSNIEVNTVDSFQGQERDVVVVSLARSSGVGFLNDAGRMNVMLTRARHALCVCLNPHAMLRNYQWRTLIEDAQKRNLYRTLPHKICQGVSAGPIPHGDVLKHITLSESHLK